MLNSVIRRHALRLNFNDLTVVSVFKRDSVPLRKKHSGCTAYY